MIMSIKQRKRKIEPGITLHHNIYTVHGALRLTFIILEQSAYFQYDNTNDDFLQPQVTTYSALSYM